MSPALPVIPAKNSDGRGAVILAAMPSMLAWFSDEKKKKRRTAPELVPCAVLGFLLALFASLGLLALPA